MNEIVLYTPDELTERIEVRINEETVWLNRQQIAMLFGRDVKTIGKHINNVFSEGELIKEVVVANFATTTQHGAIKGKTQTLKVEHYNLDVIISVGYRVKSKQGTQFRIWATNVLRDYLLKGYALNQRMNRIENNLENLSDEVQKISLQINTHLIPTQGVFFDGQVFDAYELTSKIIKTAKKNIVLIDNYIDENTFIHLSMKNKNVKVALFTKPATKQLLLDLQKANEQYGGFEVKNFTQSHDRFLIIDSKEVYHLGASLKDLGKKWFAFSKLEKTSVQSILEKINI
ncbi:virulence RhuM family protein [Paenimyroides viscosum]|uniref:DNA-binding protein n=1 Tax=Paenimyroides viscosum TaxID=2488729 RepID=A0A3P1B2T2_9FLAO|nr:RhuM family protein [Paenimyroides viscosum]RRA94972.1 DNA-binding protein [Paenimyroides viscosum]